MSHDLTVISYPAELDTYLEEVALTVKQGARGSTALFARYQEGADQLDDALNRAEIRNLPKNKRAIGKLDFVGHILGLDGFELGKESIIKGGKLSKGLVTLLNDLLPSTTTIRLLGCLTGSGAVGMALLRNVSKALNDREVIGTTTIVEAYDFDEGGLKPGYSSLVSSKAPQAFLGTPPSAGRVDAATKGWLQKLPAGYVAIGRRRPLVREESSTTHQGVRVAFSNANQLVLVEDTPDKPPLLFQWGDAQKAAPKQRPRL